MSTTLKKRATSDRISIRVQPNLKHKLSLAAKIQHLDLTEFVLNASENAADIALADQTTFPLDPKQWHAFNAALDAPPKKVSALQRLVKFKSVFNPASEK